MCAFVFTKSMVIGVRKFICIYFLHEPNNCEKCQYKNYTTQRDPRVLDEEKPRVLRGGASMGMAGDMQVSVRSVMFPSEAGNGGDWSYTTGFRCARSLTR